MSDVMREGIAEGRNEIDSEYTDEIVCPYCGNVHADSWEVDGDDGEYDCCECGKTFWYTRNISVDYSTKKLEDLKYYKKDGPT